MAWPENEAAQRIVFEPSSEDDDSNHRDTPLQCAMGKDSVSTTLEKVGEHMNGLTLQYSYLYAQLEVGSGYNNCTEAHCDAEQHVYEDADKYLKYMQLVEFFVYQSTCNLITTVIDILKVKTTRNLMSTHLAKV